MDVSQGGSWRFGFNMADDEGRPAELATAIRTFLATPAAATAA